jgi:hypothetical protein
VSKETVEVAIDEVSELWRTRQKLLTEIAEREAAVVQIDGLLKERLPDEPHVTAKIDGLPVFTYGFQRRWREREFREDYPQIAEEFSYVEPRQVIDWDGVLKEHPNLAAQYQVRALTPTRPKRFKR